MHVEGQLALALQPLLLRRDLRVALHLEALGEEFLLSIAAADLLEGILRLVDEAGAEGAEADLHECAVEENLGVDVEVIDRVLEMRHQHHVACAEVLVVEREVVDLAQHGPGPNDALAVLEEVGAEGLHEGAGVGRIPA